MPRFRSTCTDTPAVATLLLNYPAHFLIPIGTFLRKSSRDKLPQLPSILFVEMKFVGPRPASPVGRRSMGGRNIRYQSTFILMNSISSIDHFPLI
jgi:lipopolysaccharide/colanic/teichoic acid biosynthesis glycosyltransferase